MKRTAHIVIILGALLAGMCSCGIKPATNTGTVPSIEPDYSEVTIPLNIAPLHFTLSDAYGFSSLKAAFTAPGVSYTAHSGKRGLGLPVRKWRKLTAAAAGSEIKVTVQARMSGEWKEFEPFSIHVSGDRIDSHIAYRLIEPGYEIWNEMGIYQRNLENFREKAVITNNQTDYGCMNCHSFCSGDPGKMLFHARVGFGGTYMVQDGKVEKLNTKTPETISALVYPQWHNSGRYVAFSVNSTKQMFHTTDPNRVEVFDYASDVVVYDVEKQDIFSCPQLKSGSSFETFPTFSPDGRSIYYCTADSLAIPDNYDEVRYSLCRIGFDPDSASFSEKVDTLVNARETGRSVSFPRVSPDGRHLMFTMADYGNFSIWHNDADLHLLDLCTGEYGRIDELASDYVESFHNWSSDGRWVIFSSRRLDGLYTRLYIAHADENGCFGKPFLLPQRSVSFYGSLMKSYNIPEFIKGEVRLDLREVHKVGKKDPGTDLSFRK